MAEDWIKLRTMLRRDGRVRNLSRALSTNVTHVFGALATLWSIADELADEDGTIFGYTASDINAEVGIVGFCEVLPREWIDLSGDWVKLPDYQEHNGSTAKKRAQDQKRQRRRREKVEISSRANSTKSVTREEESRGENISPIGDKAQTPPPPLNCLEFIAKWAEYEDYRRANRMRKLKPVSVIKQWGEMSQWGLAASLAAIDRTISKGWQGIFEPDAARIANASRAKDGANQHGKYENAF